MKRLLACLLGGLLACSAGCRDNSPAANQNQKPAGQEQAHATPSPANDNTHANNAPATSEHTQASQTSGTSDKTGGSATPANTSGSNNASRGSNNTANGPLTNAPPPIGVPAAPGTNPNATGATPPAPNTGAPGTTPGSQAPGQLNVPLAPGTKPFTGNVPGVVNTPTPGGQGAGTSAQAQETKPVPPEEFTKMAHQDNLAEIQMAQLAEKNGAGATVMAFAKRMINNHSQADEQVVQLAKKENWTLPDKPNSHQLEQYEKLAKLKGDAFDKAYAEHMLHDHEKAIALFTLESEKGSNAAVKELAAKTLPMLKEHLKLATELAGKLGIPVQK